VSAAVGFAIFASFVFGAVFQHYLEQWPHRPDEAERRRAAQRDAYERIQRDVRRS